MYKKDAGEFLETIHNFFEINEESLLHQLSYPTLMLSLTLPMPKGRGFLLPAAIKQLNSPFPVVRSVRYSCAISLPETGNCALTYVNYI